MIELDLAVLVFVWVFFEELDDQLDSLGLDMVEILNVFWLTVLVPLEVDKDSFFSLEALRRNPLAGSLSLAFIF